MLLRIIRCFFKENNSSDYRKIDAQDLTEYSNFKFKSCAENFDSISAPSFKVIPEMILNDGPNVGIREEIKISIKDWIEFVCGFVADGSVSPKYVRSIERHMYNITVGVHKERKIKLFSRIFENLKTYGFRVNNISVEKMEKMFLPFAI